MATLFLDSFYTFKAVPWPAVVRSQREVSPPDSSLERQIHQHIIQGHSNFFQGQYQNALHEYLTAWALLPRIVTPVFPVDYARCQPDILFPLDLVETFLEAAVNLVKVRGNGVIDPIPYLTIENTPPAFTELIDNLGHIGVINVPDEAELLYNQAITQMRIGELHQAQRLLNQADEMTNDVNLKGAIATTSGVVLAQQGRTTEAIQVMNRSLENYTGAGNREGNGLVHNNLGVLYQQQGDIGFEKQNVRSRAWVSLSYWETLRQKYLLAKQANKHFQQAAEIVPLSLGRSVVQRLNPGTVSEIIRPMGTDGLNYIVQGTGGNGTWTVVSATPLTTDKPQQIDIIRYNEVLSLSLGTEGPQILREQLYETRINANTLQELRTFEEVNIIQFVTYLTHAWGFVLPVALGDTYYELGEYDKAISYYAIAKNYKYLNRAIEMPTLWRRMAQTYLEHGQLLYKERDMAGAQAQLEHILKISNNNYLLSGPLYDGVFASMKQNVLNFLNSPDPLGFSGLSYDIRIILLEARIDLRRLLANINWIGLPEDMIPIYSFEYLQNVARYFADHAIQAERTFVNFKSRQEQEAYTRELLKDAVEVEEAALALEEKRIEAAKAQRTAAQANANLAQVRINNANATLNEYQTVGWELQELDASIALANAAANDTDVRVTPGRAAQLGVEPGTYEARYYVKLLTRRRHEVNRAFEEHNMRRRRDELIASKAVADAQLAVADNMIQVANAQKELAETRLENARARLQHFNEEMFTPELWDNLAREIRHIAKQYLRWAIGAAFLMERAFEFENDLDVNRIRFDYGRSELHGLLAGDFLKQDIDSFSYERLLETEKKIPMKEIISLNEHYPFQFYRQFQKSGRIDFETHLEDFDRRYPGAHLRKIKAVEVVVDGLIPPEGLHGTLSNSGISYYRDRQGQRQRRLQKPETLLISRYVKRQDGIVLVPQAETLELFEHTGVATGWVLDIPPQQNDVDYRALVDVKLVIYYEAFYSDLVAAVVNAELAAEPNTYSMGFGIAFEFPEAFFELQDTGEVAFSITEEDMPYYQTNPLLRNITLIMQTKDAAPFNNIQLQVEAVASGTVIDSTDANGQIAADPDGTAPLNQFLGQSLLDTWRIRINEEANAAAFTAGFSWEKVSNMFFWVEYDYTPRTF